MNTAAAPAAPRPKADFALLCLLFVAVFSPFVPSLVQDWNTRPDASQGWLVLPLALWIAWTRRDAVFRQPAGLCPPALALVVVGLLGAVIAARATLDSVGRVAMVVTLNGLLLFHLGWARYRPVAFPALFLFLMIPVPVTITGAVTFPLQLFATRSAELAIGLTGIPVHRMGNVLTLPGGSLEVAEACSGLRSAMTFVTVGTLVAWRTPGAWRRVVVLALALPFALLANVVRITATGLLLEVFGPRVAQGLIHEAVGVVAFLIGLGCYAAAARGLGSEWTGK